MPRPPANSHLALAGGLGRLLLSFCAQTATATTTTATTAIHVFRMILSSAMRHDYPRKRSDLAIPTANLTPHSSTVMLIEAVKQRFNSALRRYVLSGLDNAARNLTPQRDGVHGFMLAQAPQNRQLCAQHVAFRHRRNHLAGRRFQLFHSPREIHLRHRHG